MIPRTTADCKDLYERREYILRESQQQVADRIGTFQSRISALEKGVAPRPKLWPRFAEAYQLVESEFVRLLEGTIKSSSGGENNGKGNDGTANAAGAVSNTGAVA